MLAHVAKRLLDDRKDGLLDQRRGAVELLGYVELDGEAGAGLELLRVGLQGSRESLRLEHQRSELEQHGARLPDRHPDQFVHLGPPRHGLFRPASDEVLYPPRVYATPRRA